MAAVPPRDPNLPTYSPIMPETEMVAKLPRVSHLFVKSSGHPKYARAICDQVLKIKELPAIIDTEIRVIAMADIYDVLIAWNVRNPMIGHAIKKLLQPGDRGYKSWEQDLEEAIVSIRRAIEEGPGTAPPINPDSFWFEHGVMTDQTNSDRQ